LEVEAGAHSGSELAIAGDRTGGPFAVAYSFRAEGFRQITWGAFSL